MRLPLHPTRAFLDQIANSTSHSAAPGAPPLLFIESEPFLVELQGSLELEGFPGVEGTMELMRGVQVGKVDLEVPVSSLALSWISYVWNQLGRSGKSRRAEAGFALDYPSLSRFEMDFTSAVQRT